MAARTEKLSLLRFRKKGTYIRGRSRTRAESQSPPKARALGPCGALNNWITDAALGRSVLRSITAGKQPLQHAATPAVMCKTCIREPMPDRVSPCACYISECWFLLSNGCAHLPRARRATTLAHCCPTLLDVGAVASLMCLLWRTARSPRTRQARLSSLSVS
jgi:hypothetical protein